MKKLLTIAGSDPSGGAGIQADIKTISAHNMYAMSVITALTAQNTTGVYGVQGVSPEFVASQLECVFTDIFPDAVKIGMVFSAEIIEAVAEKLDKYKPRNIVVDPVMLSTTGSSLLNGSAKDALIKKLFPLADCLTPNIPEAEILSGMSIKNKDDMLKSARIISAGLSGAVLIKGGHSENSADDLLFTNGSAVWLTGQRISNPNNHGTGCTLASAISCNLANGLSMEKSAAKAKEFVTCALRAKLALGKGCGPINHCFGWIPAAD